MTSELENEIRSALNSASAENRSNTPDYILAWYLLACLDAFDTAVQQREMWYGRDSHPTEPGAVITPDIDSAPIGEKE
jgi:hypothetical protein